jgi:diguanylate cyclase (GGDEF)-like protein/PAS domain S-box-containing protein
LSEQLADARAELSHFHRIVHAAPIGIVTYGPAREVQFVNQRVLDFTGAVDAAELEVMTPEIIHPDDRELMESMARNASRGHLSEFRIRVRPSGRDESHIEGILLPMRDGDAYNLVTLFRDVTGQIRQQEAIARFKAIADLTTDIVGIADLEGNVLYLNPAGQNFLGATGEPKNLHQLFEYVPREYHRRLVKDAFETIMRGEVWSGELELIRGSDLARCPMSAVVVGVTDDNGNVIGVACTYRDLTERKRFEAELAHAAAHDPLTGLANRQELFTALEKSLASHAPTAVLFFDLDDFKVVNDSLGHAIGDEVLCSLAVRIREGARGTDVVGRLGGDEFLIICRGVSRAHDAMTIASKILALVREPIQIGQRQHFFTGSIGIALSGQADTTAAMLVQDADIAMYRAKRAGRRQAVLFDQSMRVEAIDRLELDRELREAIERDEFELYFQPIIDTTRPSIEHFEALVRWNHPRHGRLDPAQFLPMVEQIGLMNTLGQCVLTSACRAASAMRLIAPGARVGVNVHPQQLRSRGFVDNVTRNVAAARITGEALAIEMTELAVMTEVDQIREVLEELQSIGISIAIDDFGTGYSNLGLLRRLPVDYLKIDRSFISGLGTEPGDTQVVRMILGLAHELRIQAVAEGVENSMQAAELERLGCHVAQGYLYSHPLKFDDAIALLRAQQVNPPSSVKMVPVM